MSEQLIDDYVHDLRMSAWLRGIPADRTTELEHQTRARIATELAEAGDADEAHLFEVLDRMGPASDIIDRENAVPIGGVRAAVNPIIAPFARIRFALAAHGWGVPEIGGLLLLAVGPFVLWWIGPIFGIILIRMAANRWTYRATHKATVLVFALLAVHAAISLGLFIVALAGGGPLADELKRVLASVAPGGIGRGPGFEPVIYSSGPMFYLAVVVSLLPIVAGIGSAIYLALSPRERR
jgi:hypothetical protein